MRVSFLNKIMNILELKEIIRNYIKFVYFLLFWKKETMGKIVIHRDHTILWVEQEIIGNHKNYLFKNNQKFSTKCDKKERPQTLVSYLSLIYMILDLA